MAQELEELRVEAWVLLRSALADPSTRHNLAKGLGEESLEWTRPLSLEERERFLEDVVAGITIWEETGSPEALWRAFHEWRATAEVYTDPELLAELQNTDPDD
jgi:hypothetical protein